MQEIQDLRYYKYYLISTITKFNKKQINKETRKIDKQIKELLNANTIN